MNENVGVFQVSNVSQDQLVARVVERVVKTLEPRIREAEMARSVIAALTQDAGPKHGLPEPPDVMSINEFCSWARISRSKLYDLWQAGLGPKFFKIGSTTRIPRPAAIEWLKGQAALAAPKAKRPA